MKIKTMSLIMLALIALAFLAFAPSLHAQASASPAAVTAPAADVSTPTPAAMPGADTLVGAIAAVLSPILVAGAKKLLPSLPSWAPPLLSTVIGLLVTVVYSFTASHPGLPWWAGAALGVLGVGLREVKEQVLPAPNGGWPSTP